MLGGFTAIGYFAGNFIEKRIKSSDRSVNLNPDLIRHRIFTVCTFAIFNFFFFFAGRPLLRLMPLWVQFGFDVGIVFVSTLWLQKTWRRNPDLYSRENLASRFRKQLEKLQPDLSQFLEGRSLDDLNANEVYVLAKVLPGFTREKRHEVYKGVVREALEEGYVNYSSSLEVLQQMRQELGIPDNEHREVLEELGIEDEELLNPNRQRSLENQIRLSGYQKSLERLMRLQQTQPDLATFEPSQTDSTTIRTLRCEYSITPQEEDWILSGFSPDANSVQKAKGLLARLEDWVACEHSVQQSSRTLHQPNLQGHPAILKLLQTSIRRKQELIVRSLLETLTTLPDHPDAVAVAQTLKQLSPQLVADSLAREGWQNLSPGITQVLVQPAAPATPPPLISASESLGHLETLLQHYNPLVQAASLYLIAQLDANRTETIARNLHPDPQSSIVQATADQLLSLPPSPPLTALPTLEKLVHLFNSDFFHRLQPETLIALSDRAEVESYTTGDVITGTGDTCRELLLLIEGDANIHYRVADGLRIERLHAGQILDELEVLTHSNSEDTILADHDRTRILAIPVDAVDDLLDHDPDFARRILELEARQLQRLVQSGHLL
ncbi:Crp/Fnr family transcriptional regulator [Phormidesmis priestleyi]